MGDNKAQYSQQVSGMLEKLISKYDKVQKQSNQNMNKIQNFEKNAKMNKDAITRVISQQGSLRQEVVSTIVENAKSINDNVTQFRLESNVRTSNLEKFLMKPWYIRLFTKLK